MMKKWNEYKNWTNRKKKGALIAVAALGSLALITGGVIAKYTTQNKREAQMIAAEFHISSNYLSEEGGEYRVSDWGNHGIDIQLYNYETENIALISKEAIEYEVTPVEDWNVTVIDSEGKQVDKTDKGTYLLSDLDENNELKVNQTIHLEYDGDEQVPEAVRVTVKTRNPYMKTLTADFSLYGVNKPQYTLTESDDKHYYTLTVYTNDYEDGIKVIWDETVSPDNTNPVMANWEDGSEYETLNVNSYETYELIFVKNTSKTILHQLVESDDGTSVTIKAGE